MSVLLSDIIFYGSQAMPSFDGSTTITSGINSVVTTVPVASASGFPTSGNYYIQIDTEIMLVTGGQGTLNWTITRGQLGTAAGSHSNGASLSMPSGGAVNFNTKINFFDITPNGTLKYFSEQSETITLTSTSRSASGVLQIETVTPTTVGAAAGSPVTAERLLSSAKSTSGANGNMSVEAGTLIATGTCPSLGAAATSSSSATAVLVSASGVQVGMIFRTTGGTGPNQIRQIVGISGTTVFVYPNWTVVPDTSTTSAIAQGMFLEKTPNEITVVQRFQYNAAADVVGGASRSFVSKLFVVNNNTANALLNATVALTDGTGTVTFALANSLNDTGTVLSRQTVPSSGITAFGTTTLNVPGGSLPSGSIPNGAGAQAIWLKMTLGAGAAAQKFSDTLTVTGGTT